jgi:hypothetical protein
MIPVISSETGETKYTLSPMQRVVRYEPRNVATPMMPHISEYAPYGRWEFGHLHLFCAMEEILSELTELRKKQGYFANDVVLRDAQLGDLVQRCGRGTTVLEDIKFNMTVLGGQRVGALIIAVPSSNSMML